MKNNILKSVFTFIVLLMSFNCKAQNYPQDGDNIHNSNLNKFVGTWIWANGTESLVLIFKRENVKLPIGNNIKADVLYGFHQYKQNNIVIESSTAYSNTTYADRKQTISGMGDTDFPNKIGGGIGHLSKNKSVRYEIEYIDATHIELVKLENYPGIKIDLPGKPPFDYSIALPQNIILVKQ